MDIELRKAFDFELKDIMSVKSYNYTLNKTADALELIISLVYLNANNEECFKELSKKIDLMLVDIDIDKIKLAEVNIYVVDNYGVNAECLFLIDDSKNNDNIIETSEIKELISNEYEAILKDSLKERTIITTSEGNPLDFLSFFDNNLNNYYSLKTIKVDNESELENICLKYDISMDDLLKGYDKKSGRVVFKCNK